MLKLHLIKQLNFILVNIIFFSTLIIIGLFLFITSAFSKLIYFLINLTIIISLNCIMLTIIPLFIIIFAGILFSVFEFFIKNT